MAVQKMTVVICDVCKDKTFYGSHPSTWDEKMLAEEALDSGWFSVTGIRVDDLLVCSSECLRKLGINLKKDPAMYRNMDEEEY